MTNEEDYLVRHMGKKRPFTVPDGYFDHLANRVMEHIPAAEPARRSLKRTLQPWLYAAACLVVLVASIVFITAYRSDSTQQQPTALHNGEQLTGTPGDNYIDAMADYTMVDNEDIYRYLADI